MAILDGVRLFFGSLCVLFLPGFAWSYVFFARKKIDWLERVALSFGLSIALVPISVFWLNWLFHMKITVLSTYATVGGLTVLAMIYVFAKSAYGYRKSKQNGG